MVLAVSALLCGSRSFAAAHISPPLVANTLSTDLSSEYNWVYSGGSEGVEFGHAVHTAGDVNNDGFDDILIGAPKYILNTEKEGAAFLFYGSESGLSAEPDWTVGVGAKGSRFGHAVGTAGDVNDDGYDDVVIGAPDYQVAFDGVSGTPPSGAVFVFHGSPTGPSTTPNWEIEAEARDIALGSTVSAAGDVNNDGFDDVIVAAPLYASSPEQGYEGKLYLYLGDSDGLSTLPAWTYECNRSTATCGNALDAAGDVNNDGYDDVIVGAAGWDGEYDNEGLALVFFGFPGGLQPEPAWTLTGGQSGAYFGRAVAGAGDVNNDDFDDILVGAPNFTHDQEISQNGAAFLFLGSSSGPSTAYDWVSYGDEAGAAYGHSLHTAGDVDADGYHDVIIGAYLLGNTEDLAHHPDAGAAYVFKGNSSGLALTPGWSDYGDKANAWFGYSVGTAGDVNGDGAADVLTGTPNYKINESIPIGRAYAYYSQGPGFGFSTYLPMLNNP
jgi:hypothetical protein